MKNVPFFITLTTYYLFAAIMLDVISHDGFLHAIFFFVPSIIISLAIISVFKKKTNSDTTYWELLKRFTPSIIGIELIILFFFRLYILSQI